MKKKQKTNSENYLERVPIHNPYIMWEKAQDGSVTLKIENTGLFNIIAQKIFRKPRYSYVHLDSTGSFLWPLIDGEKNILKLSELLKDEFGEQADPLYERISKFFQILSSYNFIIFKK